MSPDPENVSETVTCGRSAPATWGWALSRLPSAALSHLLSLLPHTGNEPGKRNERQTASPMTLTLLGHLTPVSLVQGHEVSTRAWLP